MERGSYVPSEEKRESFDEKWFERFKEIGSFEAYEYLTGDKKIREEQQRAFIAGEIENPTLDYPKIDLESMRGIEQSLLRLKKDIMLNESNEAVHRLYRWKINEKIAESRMLIAASEGRDEDFQLYSQFIYGKPSPEIFAYSVNAERKKLEGLLTSENENLRDAAQEVLAILPQNLPNIEPKALPTEEDFSLVKKQTELELSSLLQLRVEDEHKEFNAEEIRTIFDQVLSQLDAQGWNVVVDSSSATSIGVSQEKQLVKIPESRKLLFNQIKNLIAHEIGTHVNRRLNGERSSLRLLGLGLDRYDKGEEGVATLREQVLKSEINDYSGLDGHLAISLAAGLDGTKRDFRAVYTILEKFYLVKELQKGKDSEAAKKSAQTAAWNRSIRTFRGTTTKTPGAYFSKDIVYREGNIDVWRVVHDKPEEMLRFSIGKYDPANERHRMFLSQLGITDGDLGALPNE